MSAGRGERRPRGVLVALVAALVTVTAAAGAAPAHAAGYRYWSFWQLGGGAWHFAPTGPAQTTPADGDVEGWRFAVSPDSADAVRPRGDARFAAVCAHTPARPGSERVALVLDFGTPADAPRGATPPDARTACARIPTGASAADALAAVARPLRYGSSGLVCAISGYPAAGCGEAAAAGKAGPPAAGSAGGSDSGPSAGLLAGAGVIVALGAAAYWQARRRRES